MTNRNIIIIGGGPAGVSAAIEARKFDPAANVTLLTSETREPYEKPPLSKAVLAHKALPEDAPIAGTGGLAAHGVAVKFGTRCKSIDREARQVVTDKGRLPYDALVIASGSVMRALPSLPASMPGVHYLREAADAEAIREVLDNCRKLAVVGAGLIGLEVAATAAELGVQVEVFEFAPRILMRACGGEIAEIIHTCHRQHGVTIWTGIAVTSATVTGDGRITLDTSDGAHHEADQVIVGVGVGPDDRLAKDAGLLVDGGIVVDRHCRTSDPAIFSAGDCTRFPGPQGPVRLENWMHALDHGAVAGVNAAGGDTAYDAKPSFWSEQYDLYIQGVGWPDPEASRVTRPLDGNRALVVEVKNGLIQSALGINVSRDIAAIRRLIDRRIEVDPVAVANPERPFADMLKQKV